MLTKKIKIAIPNEQLKIGVRQGWTLNREVETDLLVNERQATHLELSLKHQIGDAFRGRFELDGAQWEITETDYSVIFDNVPMEFYTAEARLRKDTRKNG